MTHQSLSPLCEVDKSSRADLPRSAGVVYETARSENFGYDWRGKDPEVKSYIHNLTYILMQLVITIYTAKGNALARKLAGSNDGRSQMFIETSYNRWVKSSLIALAM